MPNKSSIIYGSGLLNDIELESLTAETGLAYKPLAIRDMVKPLSSGTIRAHGELKQLYDSLMLKLKDKQQLRLDRGYPFKIFIPPLAAIVLEQAKDIEHIPEAVLEVRERFRSTREKFNQLESVFSDDSYSLSEVIEAENELKSLSQILLADNERSEEARVAFLRDFGAFLIKSLVKMGVDFESLYRLLSSDVAAWVDRKYKRRGALLLLDVSKKYKSIKRYGSLIERVLIH